MRVCLISISQPSTNPRLVKEADALVEAGATVHVIGAHRADWAAESDSALLSKRAWTCEIVDWRRHVDPVLFWKSRLRHFGAIKFAALPGFERLVGTRAISRVGSDLVPVSKSIEADLFIAHNLGALSVALGAGARCGAPVGFDAEDFHSGQLSPGRDRALLRATRYLEQTLIPRCTYVTAASPGIAEAYRDLCGIPLPTCVLNVSSVSDRPAHFRHGSLQDPVRLHWFSQTIGTDRGLGDAVRAMGLLSSYPLELHVRGQWWGTYEREIRQLADQAGVHQSRIISHEPSSPEDLVRLAAEYEIGLALEPAVSTNNDIAISNKIFTYLLAGNAVVATTTRGQAHLRSELAAAARWCEPGAPQALADALRPWLDDRARLMVARRAAWQLGETRFNWESEKRTFLQVVSRFVSMPRQSEAQHAS